MALRADALILTSTLEDHLGLDTGTQTDKLERIIHASSRRFVSLCQLASGLHYREAFVERVAGHGSPQLLLDLAPVLEVSEIAYGDEVLDLGTLFSPSGRLIEREDGGCFPDTWGRARLRITYSGGYVTPRQNELDGTLAVTLPDDIQDAVLMLCALDYNARADQQTGRVKSESILDASITYDYSAQDRYARELPALVQDAVDHYRRWI